ncbi:MAG: class I SAM-dependent methyltransferase [Clostridiales bacterium]|jgi:tRNA (adenine22-N1)-methyltransferase|nr:class I SAM-dependent methyltransferase [Clostridiales bacterium]
MTNQIAYCMGGFGDMGDPGVGVGGVMSGVSGVSGRGLRPRLSVIAEGIRALGFQETVYDIGTDHAYLPIHLIECGLCGAAAAVDLRAGPLAKARRNAAERGLLDRIVFALGDGFFAIPDYEPGRAVVVAGIGGRNLSEIIERGGERARSAGALVLQPMNSHEFLREWLNENGYEITFERLAQEDRRVYSVLFCRWTGKKERYAPDEYFIGKRVRAASAAEYLRYLRFVRRKVKNRFDGLTAASARDAGISRAERGEAELLGSVLGLLEGRIRSIMKG